MEQFFPRQRIEQLTETFCGQTTRARKLTVVLVVWVLICWHLYLRHSLGAVFLQLSSAERWLADEEPEAWQLSDHPGSQELPRLVGSGAGARH